MTYTQTQIEKAKAAYYNWLRFHTINDYQPQFIGRNEAANRCDFHNKTVQAILDGDKATEAEWKRFFLNEEVKKDQKTAKAQANKAASADILAPVKAAKKIGEFGKWLNTSGNPYRSQHFSKKYTAEAVNAFLAL